MSEKDIQREAETYVLTYEDDTQRIWSASPYIPGSLSLCYNIVNQTLQWITEDHTQIHAPQPVTSGIPTIPSGMAGITDPLSFTGIGANQSLRILPTVPVRRDAQWFRQKAYRVQPLKVVYENAFATGVNGTANITPSNLVSGGYVQADGSILLPANSNLNFQIPGTYANGNYQLTFGYRPTNVISYAGDSNGNPSETDGITEFEESGDTRNYSTILPGVSPSQGWFIEIDYTSANVAPNAGYFVIQIMWNNVGVYSGDIVFTGTPGMFVTSSIDATVFQQLTGTGTLSISLLSPYTSTEKLRIQQVRFVSTTTNLSEFALTMAPADVNTTNLTQFKIPAVADMVGIPGRSDAFQFRFLINNLNNPLSITNPTFTLTRTDPGGDLIQIESLSMDLATSVTPTVDFKPYPQYRTKLLEQAMDAVKNSYEILLSSASMTPEFRIITGNLGSTSPLFFVSSPNFNAFAFSMAPNTAIAVITGTSAVAAGDSLIVYPADRAPVRRTVLAVALSDGITTATLNAIMDKSYPVSGNLIQVAGAVTYTATGLPSGITIEPVTGIIGGAPLNTGPGDYPVTVANSNGGLMNFTYRVGSGVGTGAQPYPFLWDATSTEAWMTFLQAQEKRIRTVYGTNGNQATNAQFSEIPGGDTNWFYAEFNFTGYENTTIVVTDSGTDYYRTILQVDPVNSNVIQLDAAYTFGMNVAWRIPGAFRPARPSDVGRPCLVPEGLQFRAS